MRIKLTGLLIGFVFLFGYTIPCSAQYTMTDGARKLATAMMLIDRMYVDKVDEDKLSDDAIVALLEKLDPHSSYVRADELKEMNEPLEGNFDGIGVSFNMVTDTLFIIETISGGPSEKVGVMPGDKIILVNDTTIAGVKMSTRDVMRRLKGPKGTVVNIKVLRRGEKELLSFRIIRDKIPVYSLDAAYMIDKNVGYISLARFGATTHKEFKDALAKLRKEGMKDLILDLQGNGGGYLSTAIDLTSEFLGKDKLIVYTEGANQPQFKEKSSTVGSFEKGKLVILVSEGSASASEILSGAVQDWDRGLIVGRRTFGKGLVQRQLDLPGGSAMRLTVARYHTPTGRCIQKPYTSGDKNSYERDLIERFNRGEMMSVDSIHFPDSLKYRTLVNNRVVYGGGGIMPDYFVAMDTTTTYHQRLSARGLIIRVYLAEIDDSRKELLATYPTIEVFKSKYVVSPEMFDKLLKLAADEKIEFKEDEYKLSKDLIALQIKGLMAQNLYGTDAFYKILNDINPIFIRGLELIKDDKQYELLLSGKVHR